MRRLGLAALVLAALAAAAIPCAASARQATASVTGSGESSGRTGNLIALVRSPARISAVLERSGLPEVRSIPEIGAVAVRPAPGESLARARRELTADSAVRSVQAERYRTLRYLPDDPALREHDANAPSNDFFQWNLRRAHFRKAWGLSRGRRAKLAVIDTGMDGEHPDLSGRIVYAANQTGDEDCGPLPIEPDCTGPRYDDVGHGTHVAGLACGDGNDAFGVAGAAFACKLLDEKASHTSSLTDSAIAASITDATDHGADVINMSFGGPGGSQMIKAALDRAFDHDVVLVAAASNDDTTNQGVPAQYLQPNGSGDNIRSGKGLVVTAAGYNGHRAWFDPGHGSGVSLAAYGAATSSASTPGIFSTFPANSTEIEEGNPIFAEPPCFSCRTTFHGDDRFAYLEGTSMASPQVAGAAALMRSERPAIKNTTVLRILKRTASADHFTDDLGWGILDAGLAARRARR
jgi:subtilisin family serine protease